MDYLNSGVDIEKGNDFVSIIKDITQNSMIGGFSGIIEYNNIKLVASTDGVGTKLLLCKKYNQYNTIGIDLVAMCVNDLLCQGGKPLFFLDYYAMGKLDLTIGKEIITGINEGCEKAGCLLLGGETAEMVSLYKDKDFDLAGFAVGIIEGEVYPKEMKEGDLIYGLSSSGIHSNGYSLINKLLETNDYDSKEIMKPTKIYVNDIFQLQKKYKDKIKGFSHITGGGLIDNVPRIITKGFTMNISKPWPIQDIFKWIHSKSDMTIQEMLHTYNCGIGMVIVFEKDIEIDPSDNLIELGKIIQSEDYLIDYDIIETMFQ